MPPAEQGDGYTQYCSFRVGALLIGLDARRVQEVVRHEQLTPVPLAPPAIAGLMNLRGQIVAAVDLAVLFGTGRQDKAQASVVAHAGDQTVSLLVEQVGDVISLPPDAYRRLPPGVPAGVASLLDGTFQVCGSDRLMLVLDLDRVMARLDGAEPAGQRRSA